MHTSGIEYPKRSFARAAVVTIGTGSVSSEMRNLRARRNVAKQIELPPDKADKTKRNHDAERRHCGKVAVGKPYNMIQHLSLCDQASNSDRMEADSMQISSSASTSSQPAVFSRRKTTSSRIEQISRHQVKQLMMSDMLKYRLHEAPYTSLPADGDLSTLKLLYWQNISRKLMSKHSCHG